MTIRPKQCRRNSVNRLNRKKVLFSKLLTAPPGSILSPPCPLWRARVRGLYGLCHRRSAHRKGKVATKQKPIGERALGLVAAYKPEAPESCSFDEARSPMGLQGALCLTTAGYQPGDVRIITDIYKFSQLPKINFTNNFV